MNNVKLGAAALLPGVYLVGLPGCSQGAFYMDEGIINLCRNGIINRIFTVSFRIYITSLYHKILDHAVKSGAVVGAAFCQIYEFLFILGSGIIKNRLHIAVAGLKSDQVVFFCSTGCYKKYAGSKCQESFH